MTKKQKEKVLKTIRKKDNMAYWDTIDDAAMTVGECRLPVSF